MTESTTTTKHVCAISGEQTDGKMYVLRTTEGEELVCPESLFHTGADMRLAAMLVQLQERVTELEKRGANEDQAQEKPTPATVAAAAPAKKAAARKSTARKAAS